jgi:hypothetical protein
MWQVVSIIGLWVGSPDWPQKGLFTKAVSRSKALMTVADREPDREESKRNIRSHDGNYRGREAPALALAKVELELL